VGEESQGLGGADLRVSRVLLHADGTLFAVVTGLKNGGKFVSDGPGIYRSKDKADTWEKVNTTQQFLWPKDLTPIRRTARFSTSAPPMPTIRAAACGERSTVDRLGNAFCARVRSTSVHIFIPSAWVGFTPH